MTTKLGEVFGLKRSYLKFMVEVKGRQFAPSLLPDGGKKMSEYLAGLPKPLYLEFSAWFTNQLAQTASSVLENWKDRLTFDQRRDVDRMERELGIAFHTYLSHGVPLTVAGFEAFHDNGNLSLQMAKRAVQSWLQHGMPYSVVLAGSVGSGKSHLLEAAAWTLLERGEQVLFRQEGALNAEWRAAVANHEVDEVLYALKEAPWLIIDDMGTAAWGEAGRELMDVVYDARWQNRLKTLVATNVKSSQLPARIASRLGDIRQGVVVSIIAPDHRRQQQTWEEQES